MSEALYFDNLAIGDRWKSRGRTVTEADVVNFAGVTGDYDPLHVDHEFARQSPFGKPIAHGLLGLSLVAGLGSYAPAINTIAFVGIRDWEFLKPVFIGDTVYAVNEITALDPNGRKRGRVIWLRQLVNQKGDVLQRGVFETLVSKSPVAKSAAAKSLAAKSAAAKGSAAKGSAARKRSRKPTANE